MCAATPWKDNPKTMQYEMLAKNLLKGELKRKGVSYGQLAELLTEMGIPSTERNLNNKISRGGFTAAFLIQCLTAIGVQTISL